MSWPPENQDGGGGFPSGSKKAIALRVTADVEINRDPIGTVPFNSVLFNQGISYNAATQEITITEAGTIIITASLGGTTQLANYSISAILFKNGVPFRQNSKNNGVQPYTIAPLSIVDKCIPGDVYSLYTTCEIAPSYTLRASDGVTGFELSYL